MAFSGHIIAIEGNDGSGKGLQFELLAQHLQSLGRRCVLLSFPQYEDFFGTEIGAMLSGKQMVRADQVDAKSMALWYAVDRWQAFSKLDLDGADYVLLNRYTLSNVVYQSLRGAQSDPNHNHDQFAQWVFALEHQQLGLPRPHHYLLLDVNQRLSVENVAQKGFRAYTGNQADVYEQSETLLRQVQKMYVHVASTMDHVTIIPSMDKERMLPPIRIHHTILQVLQQNHLL